MASTRGCGYVLVTRSRERVCHSGTWCCLATWQESMSQLMPGESLQQFVRSAGRPHTSWLANMKNDLSYHNLSVEDATELALDRPLWRLLAASGATQWNGASRTMMMMSMPSVASKITVDVYYRLYQCLSNVQTLFCFHQLNCLLLPRAVGPWLYALRWPEVSFGTYNYIHLYFTKWQQKNNKTPKNKKITKSQQ